MIEWEVELIGEKFDLEEVAHTFSSNGIKIIECAEKYILKSDAFSELTDVKEVERETLDILSVLNGVLKLFLGAHKPIEVASISFISEDGSRIKNFSFVDTLYVRDKMITNMIDQNGNVEESRPLNSARAYLSVAQNNETVLKVLRHISNRKLDWVTLYRIFEMIQQDVGGNSILTKNGWISSNMEKRFKHTANSPSVIGEGARHGKETTKPPLNPMNIAEAISFIKLLVHAWIGSKVV